MSEILYYTTDLMFSSRVLHEAQALGAQVRMVGKPADLLAAVPESAAQLVLLDLGAGPIPWPELQAALQTRSHAPQVIAYGPHVQEATLAAAQAAGCDQVLTRGHFHREMANLLAAAIR